VDPVQLATTVGTALGAAYGAYRLTRYKAEKQRAEDAASMLKRLATSEADVAALKASVERFNRALTELQETSMDGVDHAIEQALRGFVTLEEFRAYGHIDGDKRERMIEKMGELSGAVKALRDTIRR
jgi:hypothetical protein